MTLTYAELHNRVKGKKAVIPKPLSKGEETLAQQLTIHGIPFRRQFRFAPPRRWAFDFALGVQHGCIAIEVEGGWFSGGRHTRGKGFAQDCLRQNAAVAKGWKVLRFTTDQVTQGIAIQQILAIIQQ